MIQCSPKKVKMSLKLLVEITPSWPFPYSPCLLPNRILILIKYPTIHHVVHESKKNFLLPRIDFDNPTPLYCLKNYRVKNQGFRLTGGQYVKITIIQGNYIGLNLTQSYWCEGLYELEEIFSFLWENKIVSLNHIIWHFRSLPFLWSTNKALINGKRYY